MTIKSGTSSSSYRPCAACKRLRQKCRPECVFRPHFPGDQPNLVLENARRVFTAGRIRKMLESAPPELREDVAKSIIFESSIRAKSPIHGSYGLVLDLENSVKLLSDQLREYQTLNSPPPAVAAAYKPFVSSESRGAPTIHITLNNNHYFPGVDGTNSFVPGGNVPLGIPTQNANAFVFENANLDNNGNASGDQAFGVSNNGEDEMHFDDIVGNDSTTTQLLSFLKKFGYKVESAGKSSMKDDDDQVPFMTY